MWLIFFIELKTYIIKRSIGTSKALFADVLESDMPEIIRKNNTVSGAKTPVEGAKIHIENGLPILNIELPSRKENCKCIFWTLNISFTGQFILRPMSDTVGSFSTALLNEDSGIEVVTFYTSGTQNYNEKWPIKQIMNFYWQKGQEFPRIPVSNTYSDFLHFIFASTTREFLGFLYFWLHYFEIFCSDIIDLHCSHLTWKVLKS